MVSIGERVLVWGGASSDGAQMRYFSDGAVLDPVKNEWRRMSAAPISGRTWSSGVWTGSRFVLWGGASGGRIVGDGASYDPTTNTWKLLPPAPIGQRRAASIVWTGSRVVIWSGVGPDPSGELEESLTNDGATFDPETSAWALMSPSPLKPRAGSVFVWTGEGALAWSGCCPSAEVFFADGAMFVPR